MILTDLYPHVDTFKKVGREGGKKERAGGKEEVGRFDFPVRSSQKGSVVQLMPANSPSLPPFLPPSFPPSLSQLAQDVPDIHYVSQSVDATNVPPTLKGFRTMFACMHHFEVGREERREGGREGRERGRRRRG